MPHLQPARANRKGEWRSAPATQRCTGDGGGATVEFALVLPFLASFVLGVIDAGRAWQLKTRVTNAAREGAAVAQYTPARVNCAAGRDITDVVLNEGALPAGTDVRVENMTKGTTYLANACTGVDAGGQRVRVTVEADIAIFSPAFAVVVRSNTMTVPGYADVVVQGDSV